MQELFNIDGFSFEAQNPIDLRQNFGTVVPYWNEKKYFKSSSDSGAILRKKGASLSNIEGNIDLGQGCDRDAIASASFANASPENWLLQGNQQASWSRESNNIEDIQIGDTPNGTLRDRDSLTGMVASDILTAQAAVQTAQDMLKNFATSPEFSTKMGVAFGNSFDAYIANTLAQAWLAGDFSSFPAIAIRSSSEINGANGAFAAATDTIYLSRELVSQGDVGAVASVFLEEYGHHIDTQINTSDVPGDEGEIFSDLIQGQQLTLPELSKLQTEDDSVVLVLDGRVVAIEQANDRIQQDNLNFFAGDIKNFGGLGNELKADLFKPIEINSKGEVIDTPAFRFFKELKSTFKGSAFISPGSLGEVKFVYPLDVGVKLPDALSSDELFPIQPGINSNVNTANSFNGSKGFESPNAGVKFEFQPTTVKLTDIELKNPFGEPFKLDGVNISDPIKLEIGYDVAQFVKDIGKVSLPGGVGEISVSLPKIEEIKSATPSESGDRLPSIAGSGRTKAGEGILNLQVDVDKALSFAFPALKVLGNEIEFPNAQKEEAAAQKAKEDLQIQLDVLKTIPPEGQQLALQEAERLRQESEQAGEAAKTAKDNAGKTRFKAKLSYDLLDLKANIGVGLQQDLTFKPDDVKVTISVDKGSVEGGKEITKSFGEPFEIKAPSEGAGIMTVKAKYELSGQLENNLGFILQGSADIKALQFQANASAYVEQLNKNLEFANFQVGPLLSLQAPPGGFASKPLPFIGTDPNGKSANAFYVQIAPKRLGEVDGVEQDEKNPQPEATKNLIIEKEYKIPYNLPISVSDVTVNEKDGFAEFTVTRRQASNEQLTISYNTIGGTATASEDYQITGSTVTIEAGQNSATIRVPIINDTKQESTEQFRLILKNSDGKEFAEGVPEIDAIGTIIDDDGKPDPPDDGGSTYNDPRIVTIDKQYHDFQAVGEFTLVESTSGDLKIQVRQEPLGSDRLGSVAENTAVATVLGGKRIGIYRDRGLLIDGIPTNIANNDSLI
ncbi:Calx-beta domain-containing protein, partial [Microseira wollei]|uniref:Calx-beta domain-containing protein n=1 Tax=Microseira wollei TaxID=467598 RepID=UPI0027D9897D